MRRALAAALVAVALAGCGGGARTDGAATGTIPSGAQLVPSDVALFVALDTTFDGEQWDNARAMLDRFPDGDELLADLEKDLSKERLDLEQDIVPAAGDELDIAVWGDLESDEPELVVALTQPRDKAKLRALVAKDPENETVMREVRGWTVLSETEADLDEFEHRLRNATPLADDQDFRDAMERTPDDAAVRFYLRGGFLQEAFDAGIAEEDGPANFTRRFGEFKSFAGAVAVQKDGVRFDELLITDPAVDFSGFEPELPSVLPEGALLYVGFAHLGSALDRLLGAVEKSVPEASSSVKDLEATMEFKVRRDLLPLLDGEAALAVYPGSPTPQITYVQRVDDEAKARRVLRRLQGFATFGGGLPARTSTVDGIQVTELRVPGQSFSAFYTVFDGMFVVSSRRAGITDVRADGPKLEDDDTFDAALESAEVPDEPTVLVYANLERALPLILGYAELSGEEVPEKVRRNTEPLRSAVYFLEDRGGTAAITGFVRIS